MSSVIETVVMLALYSLWAVGIAWLFGDIDRLFPVTLSAVALGVAVPVSVKVRRAGRR